MQGPIDYTIGSDPVPFRIPDYYISGDCPSEETV
jgi:hypothetical protein